jgi:hypothetical protein
MKPGWWLRWSCLAILAASALAVGEAGAQEEVELDRVRDYLNRRVFVEGEVADVRRQQNGEVWLSLGRPYPNGPLVVVIPREMLAGHPDWLTYRGKWVRVNGMVRPGFVAGEPAAPGRMTGPVTGPTKPSIVLDNPQRLEVIAPEEAP